MANINIFTSLVTTLSVAWQRFVSTFLLNSYVTISLTALVLAAYFAPFDHSKFYFVRYFVVEEGEWWRMFTSVFMHGSLDHLQWNLITLVSSSLVCEQLNRRIYVLYLVLAMVITGVFEVWMFDGFYTSLGFSDIASGSFTLLLMMISAEGYKNKDVWISVVPILMMVVFISNELTLFGGPTVWEVISGRSVNDAPGMTLKPGHLIGAAVGFMVGLFFWLSSYIKAKR